MLKTATENDYIQAEIFLGKGIIPLRILSYMNAYGFNKEFVKFWLSIQEEKIDGVIALFEDMLIIHADIDTDISEMKTFLSMLQFAEINCEKTTAEKFGFKNYTEKQGYVFVGTANEFFSENIAEERIRGAYSLVCENIPDSFANSQESYLSFLSDYTYRKRRNLARGKCITENNSVISCAFTSAETQSEALISAVATDKKIRKGGYGKRTVLSLVNELQKLNKTAYVIALNDTAQGFYEHIGFEKDKTIVYIDRKDI